jgi:hypothetical protein
MQSSVQVLSGDTNDGRDGKHNPPNGAEGRAKKRTKAKAAKVKVNELLQSVGEEDGVTRDEWEAFVDKVGKCLSDQTVRPDKNVRSFFFVAKTIEPRLLTFSFTYP